MTNSKKPTPRKINQWVSVALIGIAAVITWFKNDEKADKPAPNPPVQHQPSSEKQTAPEKPTVPENSTISEKPTVAEKTTASEQPSARAVPADLGNYDTSLAKDKFGKNSTAPVDYYMLSLSWSPSFCESQKQRNHGKIPKHLQFQCNQAAKFGWVIHGLWPQNASAKAIEDHPRFCQGDLPPVAEKTIKHYMAESPGASLLQGEWEKHGACAFNDADSYFAKQKALFRSLNLPGSELSHKELFAWIKKFNPQLKNVRLKAGRNELYICYDKQWQPMDCQ